MFLRIQPFLLLFLFTQASNVFANSLESLDAVLSKANSVESFLASPELKANYKKRLDSYTKASDFNCRGFETNLRELDLLQSRVHGFSDKALKTNGLTALSFVIEGFKITEVPRAFHAIWLSKASEGCGQRACTEKDKLLKDPYTAVLDGTKFFVVEKNGKFTGSSIQLVPVKRDKEKFDLIFSNDSAKILKPSVLNKFLDKLKRSSKRTVLAVKVNKEKADTYYSFDGEPYFSLSEVKLEDPRAEQIFLAVGRRCGNGVGVAGNEKSDGWLSSGATPVNSGPNATNNTNANNFLANLTVNNKTGEASKGLKDLLKNDPVGLKEKLEDIASSSPDAKERAKAKDLLNYSENASGARGGDPVYPIVPGSGVGGGDGRSPSSVTPSSSKLSVSPGSRGLSSGGAGAASGSPSIAGSGFGSGGDLGGGAGIGGFGSASGLGGAPSDRGSGKSGGGSSKSGDSSSNGNSQPGATNPDNSARAESEGRSDPERAAREIIEKLRQNMNSKNNLFEQTFGRDLKPILEALKSTGPHTEIGDKLRDTLAEAMVKDEYNADMNKLLDTIKSDPGAASRLAELRARHHECYCAHCDGDCCTKTQKDEARQRCLR